MIDEDDCGAIGGMKIGRGNRSTRRKPAPAPLCPPQIPHDQTQAWTRAAAVGSQRLTAWAMARPFSLVRLHITKCLFPSDISTNNLYAVLMSLKRTECPHFIYPSINTMYLNVSGLNVLCQCPASYVLALYRIYRTIRCIYMHNSTELSPWEAPVVQLLKNFPTFHGSWRFITVFTRAIHWSLP
jgi:hypothetical protein